MQIGTLTESCSCKFYQYVVELEIIRTMIQHGTGIRQKGTVIRKTKCLHRNTREDLVSEYFSSHSDA